MPKKPAPFKPNPEKMKKVGFASRMAYIDSLGRGGKKTKGADKEGNIFVPNLKKPKGNRRRILDKINSLSERD